MQTINMNDTVKVKLTEHGKQILKENHDMFWKDRAAPYEFKLPKEDENGYSSWQLWGLFQEFGHKIGLGFKLPFETGMIIVKE